MHSHTPTHSHAQGRIDIIFCTGERFESLMQHLLSARMSAYRPKHASKLANPCRLYLTSGPEVTPPKS